MAFTLRRRVYKKKNQTTNTSKLTKIVKNHTRRLKQVGRVEMKNYDQYSSTTISSLGYIVNISDITQGPSNIQRIGNVVTLKSLEIRSYFTSTNFGLSPWYSIRFVVVLDKMGMNFPTVAEIFEPVYLNTGYASLASYNENYRARFRILSDRTIRLNPETDTLINLKIKKSLNVQCHNIGTSTTFKNHIYIVALSSETNLLALPLVNWTSRLMFTDV